MASITDAEIKRKIKSILQDADLSTLSAKKVRKKLEEMFDTDFTNRKKEVDAMTMELLTEQIEAAEKAKANGKEEDDDDNEEEDEKDDEVSSDEDKPEPAPPKKKMKTEKKPVKKSSSLSSEPNEDDEDDAEVARRLQEEESTSRRPSRAVAKKPVKRKERMKREKGAGGTCYTRPCYLSEDLADIMGTSQMARNEIVKKMWEIIRERNLQDPKNKQWMICDDQLLKVFGKKKVKTFGMMKYLKNHIKDVKDVS